MVKLFLILLLSSSAYASLQYETKWQEITIEKGFTLSEYLRSEGCFRRKSRLPEILSKNPHLKSLDKVRLGQKMFVPDCSKDPEKPKYPKKIDEVDSSTRITGWKEIYTPHGFVLSQHLYFMAQCLNIWEKQVPEFMKVNPHVENPDDIPVGTKIKVQYCSKEFVIESKPLVFLDEHRFEVFGGILKEDGSNMTVAGGFNILGSIKEFLGYRMFMLASPETVLYFLNAEFRTKLSELRYFASAGLGQRIGKTDEDRLSEGVDSFGHVGVGVIYQPRGDFYIKAEGGVNLSPKPEINFEISGMKKFDDYWLGGFFQFKSTRSFVDEGGEGRNYIFVGAKASF